jgi:hypothetical protein
MSVRPPTTPPDREAGRNRRGLGLFEGEMKRPLALGLVLAALFCAPPPSGAAAQESIDAVFLAEYSAPSYSMDQGEILVFRNRDPFLEHGVVSDHTSGGEPLFEAPVAPPRRTRLVRNAPFLTDGSYPFHCPVHPEMTATLVVTANGEPLPPDSIAPTAVVKVQTKRLGALLNRRRLRLAVNPSEAEDVALSVRAGGIALASPQRTYVVPGPRTLEVRIRRRAVTRLRSRVARLQRRGRRSLRLVAAANLVDVAGNAGSAVGARRLRLPGP